MDQKSPKVFHKQPIMCPWITSQPYPSTFINKNRRLADSNINGSNNSSDTMQMDGKVEEKPCASMQQSSSQFFYFLRLMQLFPDTHPATLHTVLTLCKNDFFCAVDKLLYAKRCKIMYNRRQSLYQKFCHNRSQPYSNTMTVKPSTIQSKDKNVDKPGKSGLEKTFEVAKQSVIVKTNETLSDIQIGDAISISVPDTLPISPNKETERGDLSETIVEDLTEENITI